MPLILNRYINLMGRKFLDIFEYSFNVFMMIYLSVRAAFYDQAQGLRTVFSVVSSQIYFTGWQALPLISVLALASGSIVILQSSTQLSLLGGSNLMGDILVAVVVRELCPLITALIVIARSGTAVASEIGTMRVNNEIEALEVMGINPLSYIVFPRMLGGIISVLCLAFYFTMVALIGGFLVTKLQQNLPFAYYLDSLAKSFSFDDVYIFFLKNTFSGAIIFIVSCYQGMLVERSPHEVPQVTTKAVMNCVIYVVVFNLSVTLLFYIKSLVKLGIL